MDVQTVVKFDKSLDSVLLVEYQVFIFEGRDNGAQFCQLVLNHFRLFFVLLVDGYFRVEQVLLRLLIHLL